MIEKFFMACDADNEQAAQYGPFNTSEEAEHHMLRLGWDWVVVYTHTLDEFGTILDVKTRFYQPDTIRLERKPDDVEHLRRKLEPAHAVAPLTEDEIKFFAKYEEQMANVPVAEVKKVDWRKDSRLGAAWRRARKANG